MLATFPAKVTKRAIVARAMVMAMRVAGNKEGKGVIGHGIMAGNIAC